MEESSLQIPESSFTTPLTSKDVKMENSIVLTAVEGFLLSSLKGREIECGRVLAELVKFNTCPRCTFRFLKVCDIHLYRENSITLERLIYHLIELYHEKCVKEGMDHRKYPIPIDGNVPCRQCLGILQLFENTSSLDRSLDSIRNSDYKAECYCLALTLPTSTILRHYQMWYYLQNKFPDISMLQTHPNDSDIPEIKEVFKWVLGYVIFQRLGLQFQFEAKLEIRFIFSHPETQSEYLKLNLPTGHDRSKKVKVLMTNQCSTDVVLNCCIDTDGESSNMNIDESRCHQKTNGHINETNRSRKKRSFPSLNLNGISAMTLWLQNQSKEELCEILHSYCNGPDQCTDECAGGIPIVGGISQMIEFDISFYHLPIYVAGRYCKYKRNIPQSPWILENGIRKGDWSVQELMLRDMIDCFGAERCKFMSAGREDIDVRMLGNGRPFVMEMINPRRPKINREEYLSIQSEINRNCKGKIFVVDLQEVGEKEVDIIRQGEESKTKSYKSLIWTPNSIDREKIESLSLISEFDIDQLTPIRVLHRRSLSTRKRKIIKISAEYINAHYSILNLTTQAGTYIKEFIHSDLGRTTPSLCDILQQDVDIVLLDVINVHLDFPKKIQCELAPPIAKSITDSIDLNNIIPMLPIGEDIGIDE